MCVISSGDWEGNAFQSRCSVLFGCVHLRAVPGLSSGEVGVWGMIVHGIMLVLRLVLLVHDVGMRE